jgi:hypothetical protein
MRDTRFLAPDFEVPQPDFALDRYTALWDGGIHSTNQGTSKGWLGCAQGDEVTK